MYDGFSDGLVEGVDGEGSGRGGGGEEAAIVLAAVY